jgi:hypothetical protein
MNKITNLLLCILMSLIIEWPTLTFQFATETVSGKIMNQILTLLLVAGSFNVYGASSKVSRDLDYSSASPVDVIVECKGGVTAPTAQQFVSRGGILRRSLALVNAFAASLPASSVEALANDPNVAFISLRTIQCVASPLTMARKP